MRRFWFLVAMALAAAGASGLFMWPPGGGSAADAPYRLASVDRGTITASVRATGTLNPVTTVLVSSQLSGQVVEILADYNSPVQAGQVVARLYAEQIKARRDAARADLEQAKADIGMRRAQLDKSRASLQKAEAATQDQLAQRDRVRAQLAEAERNLDRQAQLNARDVGSQTALDQARTQVDVQQATLASAEAQIASNQADIVGLKADIALAEAQLQSAEAAILQREAKLKDIEIDLSRTEIRSPVEGVVVKRDVELGQTVAASLSAPTLFTIAQDLRDIDIYANIDEADVGLIKDGQPVTFTVNAYPNRSFNGRVRMVRLGAQTVQNVVTYTAVVKVDNQDLALLPGMTANLQIVTDERRNVLRVPNAALRYRPAGSPGGATVAAASAVPQNLTPEAPVRGSGRPLQQMRERLIAEVQPTSEQLAAIDGAITETRASFSSRRGGSRDDGPRGELREARQALQAKILAVLDPERRRKFESALAEGRKGPASVAADPGAPGRLYVMDADDKPQPVALRLGITDGTFTEVIAGDLKEGAGVVVGGGPRPQGGLQSSDGSVSARPPRQRGPRLF